MSNYVNIKSYLALENIFMIWKDVSGFEGLYMVSDSGQVKSLSRPINSEYRSGRTIKERILINSLSPSGYYMVNLYKDKMPKYVRVHRLIADSFLPKQNGKNMVNHINGIRTDNRIENLEWCTSAENVLNALNRGAMFKKFNHKERSIILECIENGFKKTHIARYFRVCDSTIGRIVKNMAG